jgi:hypothetical protein
MCGGGVGGWRVGREGADSVAIAAENAGKRVERVRT